MYSLHVYLKRFSIMVHPFIQAYWYVPFYSYFDILLVLQCQCIYDLMRVFSHINSFFTPIWSCDIVVPMCWIYSVTFTLFVPLDVFLILAYYQGIRVLDSSINLNQWDFSNFRIWFVHISAYSLFQLRTAALFFGLLVRMWLASQLVTSFQWFIPNYFYLIFDIHVCWAYPRCQGAPVLTRDVVPPPLCSGAPGLVGLFHTIQPTPFCWCLPRAMCQGATRGRNCIFHS